MLNVHYDTAWSMPAVRIARKYPKAQQSFGYRAAAGLFQEAQGAARVTFGRFILFQQPIGGRNAAGIS